MGVEGKGPSGHPFPLAGKVDQETILDVLGREAGLCHVCVGTGAEIMKKRGCSPFSCLPCLALGTHCPFYLSSNPPPDQLSISSPIYMSIYPSTHSSMDLSIYHSFPSLICLSFHLSIHLLTM